eukprot:jgi/Astpho2/3714/fgenesh1_pg.00060_%23_31_t
MVQHGAGLLDSSRNLLHAAAGGDLTELTGLDNLSDPQGTILEAQQLAAAAFGADRTWFLVNGTTVGVHAAVMATCRPGSRLALARNCHKSAYEAMALAGVDPLWMAPVEDAEFGVAHHVTAEVVEDTLALAGKANGWPCSAVLITSPTYYGACSNAAGIAEVCHRWQVPLIVDEAHGSHFCFHQAFPQDAMAAGADIAVQSTHKTLSSLTQASMLHMQGGRSSSPSYLLMASLDAARAQAQQPGAWEGPLQAARQIRTAMCAHSEHLTILSSSPSSRSGQPLCVDPLRITLQVNATSPSGRVDSCRGHWRNLNGNELDILVLQVEALGMTGFEVAAWLETRNIFLELATRQRAPTIREMLSLQRQRGEFEVSLASCTLDYFFTVPTEC